MIATNKAPPPAPPRMGVITDPDAKARAEIQQLGFRLQSMACDPAVSVQMIRDTINSTMHRVERDLSELALTDVT